MMLRALGLVPLLVCTPALAGTMQIDLLAASPASIGSTEVRTHSTDLALESTEPGSFNFSFKNDVDITGLLTIRTASAPIDAEAFEMRFDIPFFWDADDTVRLAAAIVPTTLAPDTAEAIVRDGRALPQSAAGLILLNHRARIAFGLLREEFGIRAPNSNDAMVAFIFALTARELGYRYFLEPDDEAIDLVSWLAAATEGPDAVRLFPRATELADAREVVRQFNLIPAMQRALLVDTVSKYVGRSSTKERGCGYARSLDELFFDIIDMNEPADSANRRREIQNLTNVVLCEYATFAQGGTAPSRRLEAQDVVNRMESLIQAYAPPDEHGRRIVEIAQSRANELSGLLATLE